MGLNNASAGEAEAVAAYAITGRDGIRRPFFAAPPVSELLSFVSWSAGLCSLLCSRAGMSFWSASVRGGRQAGGVARYRRDGRDAGRRRPPGAGETAGTQAGGPIDCGGGGCRLTIAGAAGVG